MMKESVAVTAAANLVPTLAGLATGADLDGGFPAESMHALHQAGFCAAPLPRGCGGQGLNDRAERLGLLRVLKHIGRGDLVVGRLYEGHVNALQLIFEFGNAAQQDTAAQAAGAGQWFGVWNSQGEHGVRLAPGAGAAQGGWVLNGSKLYASGAGHIEQPLVTAELPGGGWQMVLAQPGQSAAVQVDRSFWQPLGMRASASYRVQFADLPVRATALVGAPGDYYREPAFSAGAVRFAAVQLGGAEAVLDETRRMLRSIQRADDPYQRIRLGEMAMWVESGNLWCDGAASHVDDVPYAHLMRSAIEHVGLRVMQLAERSVGARGLLKPSALERLHRDLTQYLRQPAPDAVLAAAGAHVLSTAEPTCRLRGR